MSVQSRTNRPSLSWLCCPRHCAILPVVHIEAGAVAAVVFHAETSFARITVFVGPEAPRCHVYHRASGSSRMAGRPGCQLRRCLRSGRRRFPGDDSATGNLIDPVVLITTPRKLPPGPAGVRPVEVVAAEIEIALPRHRGDLVAGGL